METVETKKYKDNLAKTYDSALKNVPNSKCILLVIPPEAKKKKEKNLRENFQTRKEERIIDIHTQLFTEFLKCV